METIEKRKELVKFCDTYTDCETCPLNEPVCRCGCGTHFMSWKNDEYDMSDDEINDAYKIAFPEKSDAADSVNHPSHYTDGKIEVIDYIEDKKLGFCLGNAIKYISRAGKKDPSKEVEDLKKARWYIDRRIKEIEEGIV